MISQIALFTVLHDNVHLALAADQLFMLTDMLMFKLGHYLGLLLGHQQRCSVLYHYLLARIYAVIIYIVLCVLVNFASKKQLTDIPATVDHT